MTTKTETIHAGEHLVSEGNKSISRESIVIASGEGELLPGTVLGKVTASGEYRKYESANADGSEVAAGILFDGVDATSVAQDAVAHVRDCEVAKADLTWETPADETAGTADLLAEHVILRD
jgi:hypothetical protein